MEFSSPEYWKWVAYPFSSGSSNPGIERGSAALQADFYQLSYQGSQKHKKNKPQLNPPVGWHQSLPPGSLHKPLRPSSTTRRKMPEARGTIVLQLVGPQIQEVRQNKMEEEYVPDEGTRRTTK